MSSTSYKDLELSLHQHLILFRLRYFKIKKDTIRTNLKYSFLGKYALVDYYPNDHLYFILSDKGKMYLRYKRKERIRFWIPIIISITALLGGYGIYTNPILAQLLQGVMTTSKTIAENLGAFF